MKKELNNWQTMDSNHFLHPFTDHHDLSKKGTRVITKGDGIYIWDSEGNKILDGMSGLWCVSLGYGNDELIQAAYDQMKELPYYNSFFQCAHPPAIELSQKISDIAPDSLNSEEFIENMSKSFFEKRCILWRQIYTSKSIFLRF